MPKGKGKGRRASEPDHTPISSEALDESQIKQLEQEDEAQHGADAIPDATFVVSKQEIERIRGLSAQEQYEEDEANFEGVKLFFANKFHEAEATFAKRAHHDPLACLCWGSCAFLRAVMSFAKEDVETAQKRLATADKMANSVMPKDSYVGSFTKFVTRAKTTMTNCQIRLHVIQAEANVLTSCLLLTQETMVSYVKAGFALRRGFKHYDIAQKAILESGEVDAAKANYDNHTLGGVQFGIGSVNVVLASLPQKLLNIISLFGFPHDKEKGMKLLNRAFAGQGIRSTMASCFLLTNTGVIPSFAPVVLPQSMPEAERVMKESLEIYPQSCIHLWLAGRIVRNNRNIDLAIKHFQESLNSQDDFPQLKHLSYYEMAWCHAFTLEWEKAAEYFEKLATESNWSKAFNMFAQAACLDQAGKKEAAAPLYAKAPTIIGRKLGGKLISAEQFVIRRTDTIFWDTEDANEEDASSTEGDQEEKKAEDKEENNDDDDKPNKVKEYATVLPGIELVMLFNGFCQMRVADLETVLKIVQAKLQEVESKVDEDGDIDEEKAAVLHLMLGGILKNLGQLSVAQEHYDWIVSRQTTIKEEKYTVPYALFELASMKLEAEDWKEGKALLTKAGAIKDYNFEMRLHLRVHLANPYADQKLAEEKEKDNNNKKTKKQTSTDSSSPDFDDLADAK